MTKKKDTVTLVITCCDECRFLATSRYYTSDSFEQVVAWNCAHSKFKGVKQGTTDREDFRSPPGISLQDWNDEKPAIPKWCPLRKKRSS